MAEFSSSITIDGMHPAVMSVPRGTLAWRKANQVLCPVGSEPTRAHILLLRKEAAAIDRDVTHDIQWKTKDEKGKEIESLTFKGMYLNRAERLLQGGPEDDNSLYLCEFVDARSIAKSASDSGLDMGGSTWEEVAENLWVACEVLGDWPDLPYAPDGQPGVYRFTGKNPYDCLNALLDILDCAIRHDPLEGVYEIKQLGGEQEIPEHRASLKWDGEPLAPVAVECAAEVAVYFNNHDAQTVTTDVDGATGTFQIWDDLPSDGDDDVRAAARVERYALRRTVERKHKIFFGLIGDILPGEEVRAVLWRNWDDGDESRPGANLLGGTVTEFVAGPDVICPEVEIKAEWGWARLEGDLDALGEADARVWYDTFDSPGTMTDSNISIKVRDRLVATSVLTLTRITWKLDATTGKYYIDDAACEPDTSSTIWGS